MISLWEEERRKWKRMEERGEKRMQCNATRSWWKRKWSNELVMTSKKWNLIPLSLSFSLSLFLPFSWTKLSSHCYNDCISPPTLATFSGFLFLFSQVYPSCSPFTSSTFVPQSLSSYQNEEKKWRKKRKDEGREESETWANYTKEAVKKRFCSLSLSLLILFLFLSWYILE